MKAAMGIALVLLAAWAQTQADAYAKIRELMEAAVARQRQAAEAAVAGALAQQRAAIEAQLRATGQVTDSGFSFSASSSEPLPGAEAPPPSGALCEPIPEDQLGPLVEQIAEREGLTPDLLRAVIEKESSRLPCAVSPKGAQGLMQLMPATAMELGVGDPFNPVENVSAGARLLRRLLSRYGGDLALALGAYNAGPAYIDAFGQLPPIRETLQYVGTILGQLTGSSQQAQR